jgi:hypothetical protein
MGNLSVTGSTSLGVPVNISIINSLGGLSISAQIVNINIADQVFMTGILTVNGRVTVNNNMIITGTINGSNYSPNSSSSTTITHKTNIIYFTAEQIDCFCETTGEIADVCSHPIEPNYPCNAICNLQGKM